MSESIIKILEKALDGADKDRDYLLEQLEIIQKVGDSLREIIYLNVTDEDYKKGWIPIEFSNPEYFVTCWDAIDRALANTVLMVMPPSIFEPANIQPQQPKQEPKPAQPIIITANPQQASTVKREASKGFWSGYMDYRIAKVEMDAKKRKAQKPTITTEKITYDPKEVVFQLIPSLNELKQIYYRFLHRHQSNRTPSIYLLKHGHALLQEQMSKYFNVINPFCIASITFQIEKIRKDKLSMSAHFSRIAQAEAEARAYSQVYIPQEVRSLARAIQEGSDYFPEGISMLDNKELLKKMKRKKTS